MKNLKIIAIALISVFSFSSCSNDDPIVNEEEVITTVDHNLTAGSQTVTLTSEILTEMDLMLR
jgi:hypothetical protein